ncbi:uncharacterized protein LOC135348523 [Halichondria panicea]|uniref:uncharacterized protein LOC135348523 n=1 Tax=Halichondria panicea TaxID=6063 RepID=UPI00312BC17E
MMRAMQLFTANTLQLFAFTAASLTTSPSTVACPDDTVTFTCTLPGSLIRWTVFAAMAAPQGRIELFRINLIPNTNINETGGDPAFRGVLTDSSGPLTATLTSLSEASIVEGTMVECDGESSQEGPLTITVHVADPPSRPLNPRVSFTLNQPSSSNITLDWDSPSSTGGVSVSYVLTISPTPLSGSPVTMETTSAQITVFFNTPYNVIIRAVNCAGMSDTSIFTVPSIVSCPSSLSAASGVVIVQIPSVPTVGSTLTFTCFESNQMIPSTCGSDGQWSPNPEDFMCPTIVTCDVPAAPSMGSVNTNGQSYTEGSQVTYQCNDGLFPMCVLTATCTRDGQNGVWEPDPSVVVCRTSPVNCFLPEEPSNRTIVNYERLNVTVLEGTVLTYQCDNGLSLTGPNTITCTNAGVWSTEPEAIKCVSPTEAPTAATLSTDVTVAIGVTITFIASTILGFLVGLLVMYSFTRKKAVYYTRKTALSVVEPTKPVGPVYEEVSPKEEIELNTNQAYGPVGL